MTALRIGGFLLLNLWLLIAAGCASTNPVHLLLLEPGVTLGNHTSGSAVGIRPVVLPEYLRRNGLVFSEQNHAVTVSGHARWAEPLEDGILRVTTINLAELLATSRMLSYPWQASQRPDIDIVIQVIELTAKATQARLIADIQIQRRDEQGNISTMQFIRSWQRTLENDPQAVEVARAYSDLLLDMAQAISATINPR